MYQGRRALPARFSLSSALHSEGFDQRTASKAELVQATERPCWLTGTCLIRSSQSAGACLQGMVVETRSIVIRRVEDM